MSEQKTKAPFNPLEYINREGGIQFMSLPPDCLRPGEVLVVRTKNQAAYIIHVLGDFDHRAAFARTFEDRKVVEFSRLSELPLREAQTELHMPDLHLATEFGWLNHRYNIAVIHPLIITGIVYPGWEHDGMPGETESSPIESITLFED